MKKLIVLLLILTIAMPTTVFAAGVPKPPVPGVPPSATVPLLGVTAPAVDTAALDKALAWSQSLSDEQRAQIRDLLAVVALPEVEVGAAKLEETTAAFSGFQEKIETGLGKILSAEQMKLFKESVAPMAAIDTVNGTDAVLAQADCLAAYTYNNTAYYYGYYYYYYANIANAATTDAYSPVSLNLAYNTYAYAYHGAVQSYNAYIYYPNYTNWSYYYTGHAYHFALYGYAFSYMLQTWVSNTNTQAAYNYAYNAWLWMPKAELASRTCRGYAQDTQADNRYFMPLATTLGGFSLDEPAVLALSPELNKSTELVAADRAFLDKMDMGTKLARSLSAEQRKAIEALVKATPAPFASKGDAAAAAAWRDTLVGGMKGILSADQYKMFQDSLLPAPDVAAPEAPTAQADCYNAFYKFYYGYGSTYNYYLNAYYAYLNLSSEPFLYPNYLIAAWAANQYYYAYTWGYTAYTSYTTTNRYNSYYYADHAYGLSYYGYYFALTTKAWAPASYTTNAAYYANYAYYYAYQGQPYAKVCYTGP